MTLALRKTAPVLVIIAAIAALAVNPGDSLAVDVPATLALWVAACVAEVAPLSFVTDSSISIGIVSAALLWRYDGVEAAMLAVGTAALGAAMVRRHAQPTQQAAVLIVTVWGAASLAAAALPPRIPAGYGIIIFCAAYTLIEMILRAATGQRSLRAVATINLAAVPLAVLTDVLVSDPAQLPMPVLLGAGVYLIVAVRLEEIVLCRRLAAAMRRSAQHIESLGAARDRLSTVVEHAADGIFTLDNALRIEQANAAFLALTGLEREVVVGRVVGEVLGPAHERANLNARRRRGRRGHHGIRISSRLGARDIVVGYTLVEDRAAGAPFAVGIVHDITVEREQANVREDFFSLVMHDLRNPLTAIVGTTDMLRMEIDRVYGDMAPAHRYIDQLEHANQQLMRLVNNLLDLQRIEDGRTPTHFRPVALGPLVDDLADEFSALAHDREQEILLSGPNASAWGDPTWCREIVANLLSNAIKYTPRGGTIELSIEPRGGTVAVNVRDTGHGLSVDEQAQLFTKFFRSKRPELRAARGSGLGLALTKRMAERMNGDIVVRSAIGEGSTFTLLLPLGDLPPFVMSDDRLAIGQAD